MLSLPDIETANNSAEREPSVSTMLMNFSMDFDPYGALSTPLYQTATFKQVSLFYFIFLYINITTRSYNFPKILLMCFHCLP